MSFWIPPNRKADTNAALEIGRSHGSERMAVIQRGVSVFGLLSNRPTGTTERSPEAPQIRNRNPARPSARVVMPMNRAAIGADTLVRGLHAHHQRRFALLAPG